jgi:hypothetical protein
MYPTKPSCLRICGQLDPSVFVKVVQQLTMPWVSCGIAACMFCWVDHPGRTIFSSAVVLVIETVRCYTYVLDRVGVRNIAPSSSCTWIMAGSLMQYFPMIEVGVAHDYDVPARHNYQCTQCGYRYARFQPTINVNEDACHICRGDLEHDVHNLL